MVCSCWRHLQQWILDPPLLNCTRSQHVLDGWLNSARTIFCTENSTVNSRLCTKIIHQQECILVGCVPPAAVAVTERGVSTAPRSRHPLEQAPLRVWAWRPPLARPLSFPLGCGPGNLQGMLGYHAPWRPSERLAGIPPAMHAGIPPPLPPPRVNRITDTCKNITLSQLCQTHIFMYPRITSNQDSLETILSTSNDGWSIKGKPPDINREWWKTTHMWHGVETRLALATRNRIVAVTLSTTLWN